MAPQYRLRLASIVGNRNLYSARRLFQRIRRCLDGTLPLFTSDAFRPYAEVLLEAFGVWQRFPRTGKRGRPRSPRRVVPSTLYYAQVQKERRQGRVIAVTRSIIFGDPAQVQSRVEALRRANRRKGQINTAYIERDNLTLRQEVRRLARKTLGFSKKRRPLQRALDFIDAYDNFVRPHGALRIAMPDGASPRRWRHRTPTMAAGLTDHSWTLEELLWHR